MKTLTTLSLALMIIQGVSMNAQTAATNASTASDCETTFITLGTGINSNYGIVGLGADFKLLEKVQVGLSGGLGSWGFKTAGEFRYFYSGCMQQGSAFTAGVAYASGLPEMQTDLELSNAETKTVKLKLGAQTNMQLSWYRAFKIMDHHRFFVQVGYSFPITGISYSVTSGETLSDTSKSTMKMMAPGGIIVATGFGFGF